METIFECDNCLKQFARKSHLEQHKNKKNPCKPNPNSALIPHNLHIFPHFSAQKPHNNAEFLQNQQIQQNQDLNNQEVLDNQNISNNTDNLENMDNMDNMGSADNFGELENVNNIIICKYCNNTFSRKDCLKRHLKNNCKVKKQQDEEKEKIFQRLLEQEKLLKMKDEQIDMLVNQNGVLYNKLNDLEDKVEKITKSTKSVKPVKQTRTSKTTNSNNTVSNNSNNSNNTTTTTTNTNSNNVVFNLVNYGKEDLDKIDIKYFIDNVVKNTKASGVKIPEEILKLIHFNPDYPEHNNIYISDINREKCMVYEDNEWKLTLEDKIPDTMDKVVQYSYTKQEELREKYPNNKGLCERLDVINKYTQFMDLDFLEELKDRLMNLEGNNLGISSQIARCEDFHKKAYNTFKLAMYNEGTKIKQRQKQRKNNLQIKK